MNFNGLLVVMLLPFMCLVVRVQENELYIRAGASGTMLSGILEVVKLSHIKIIWKF